MINELIKALLSENILDYKIVQTNIQIEEYQFIYGKKKDEVNNCNKLTVYFYWNKSIKEFSIEGSIMSIIELIHLAKKLPGAEWKWDKKFFYNNLTNNNKTKIIEPYKTNFAEIKYNVCQNLDNLYKKYNIVLIRRDISMTIWTPSFTIIQNLLENDIYYLDLLDNKNYYNINFKGNTDYWCKLVNKMNADTNPIECLEYICNTSVFIKAPAFAKILNAIVELFHVDIVYLRKSFFDLSMLASKICSKDVSIISVPYENIFFDSEGNFTQRKYLIQNGYLRNVLSNSAYSNELDDVIPGDASILNSSDISNQRIIFKANYKKYTKRPSLCILSYHHQKFEKTYLYGSVNIKIENQIKKSFIKINIKQLLNTVNYISKRLNWEDNVLTSNIICTI